MKNNFYISFGVWLSVVPFLGVPNLWRNILIVASGIFLVIVFAGPIVLKKLQSKKPKKKKEIKVENKIDSSVPPNEIAY